MTPRVTVTPGNAPGREIVHVLGRCAGAICEDVPAVAWIALPIRGPITEHSTRADALLAVLTSEET